MLYNAIAVNRLSALKMLSIAPKQTIKWAFDSSSWHPTESQWLLATSCIQLEEKERIGKFVFKRDAKASLIGRLLIRKFLSSYSDLKYNEIILKRDDRGKPFLYNKINDKLFFNVSHQGKWVVLVGHLNGVNVGTDVMATIYKGGKNLDDFFRLMSRHFSTSEWDVIKKKNFDDETKMFLFNRYWALKESYVKATGVGIVTDLRRIEFKINTLDLKTDSFVNDTKLYVDNLKENNWCFQEVLLDKDHLVAIASNSVHMMDDSPFHYLDFNCLMDGCIPILPEDKRYCEEFFQKDEEPY